MMVRLQRTVRLAVNPDQRGAIPAPASGTNGFAGTPPVRGLARWYELEVSCQGNPDPRTGYLINIKDIDHIVHDHALPIIARACAEAPTTEPAALMPELLSRIAGALPDIFHSLRWQLTPFHALEITMADPQHVLMRQQFDFAAAHRLHNPAFTPAQNVELFGKCNNPQGHGHNYRIEPAVALPIDSAASPAFTLEALERITEEVIIQRFDHKHLNLDTVEFADSGGLNPSIENIAKVCFDLLKPAIAAASRGSAELRSLTAWETDRTRCTYPA